MKRLVLLTILSSSSFARANVVPEVIKRPLICGESMLKFKSDGESVTYDGQEFTVDWAEDGPDARFGDHEFRVTGRTSATLDGVTCFIFNTAW